MNFCIVIIKGSKIQKRIFISKFLFSQLQKKTPPPQKINDVPTIYPNKDVESKHL